MDISGIISLSGKPGLSKIITQSRTGLIVESLIDGKKFPISGAERVSTLEDISIYTYEEDVLLLDIFKKMYEKYDGKESISHKSPAEELRSEFEEILPNYDADRVYNSDLKKVFQWYNLLLSKGYLKAEKKETKKKATEKKAKQSIKKENEK